LLKNYLHMADASDLEVKSCLEVARRYRIDPFKKGQIWFIKRWDSAADNGHGGHGAEIYTPQLGIYGMAQLAARDHKDFGTLSQPEYGPETTVEVEGHKIKGPSWCVVKAFKKGMSEPSVGEVWFEEYCPKKWKNAQVFWATYTHRMLAKCAKAQALREAYPDLAGLMIPEEMDRSLDGFTPEGRQIAEGYGVDVGAPTGSHAAAQEALQVKLQAAAASPDPKVAEIAKKALRDGGAESKPDSGNSQAERLSRGHASPVTPAPPKIVWIKTMPDHDIAASGYLADDKMCQFLTDVAAVRFKSAKDGTVYWRFAPQYLEGFKALAGQLGVDVQ
jgi:hypothetical protein